MCVVGCKVVSSVTELVIFLSLRCANCMSVGIEGLLLDVACLSRVAILRASEMPELILLCKYEVL